MSKIQKADIETTFVNDIRTIVSAARESCYRMANIMQVVQNWLIGRHSVTCKFGRQCLPNLVLTVSCCLSNCRA